MRIYDSIQAMRGVAALIVVIGHATALAMYNAGLDCGFAGRLIIDLFRFGVDIFFVISGFIIATTVSDRVDRHAGRLSAVGDFLVRRVVRIYPIYWIVLVLSLALNALFPTLLGPTIVLSATVTPAHFLLTTYSNYFVPTAWTLYYEIQFYGAVAFILLLIPGRLFASIAALSVVFVVARVRGYVAPFPVEYLVFLEFSAGVGIAFLARHRVSRFARPLGLLAAVPLAAGMFLMDAHPGSLLKDYEQVLTFGLAATLLIYAVVAAEQRGATFPPLLRWVGDVSYSAYIWHWMVLLVARETAVKFLPTFFQIAIWVGVSFAVAYVSYTYLERPILRLIRGALSPSAPLPQPTSGA